MNAQPAGREERDLALGLALEQVRADHERRAQLVLLDRVRELDVGRLVVLDEEDLGQLDVEDLRDVVEQLGEHQRIALELAAVLALDAEVLVRERLHRGDALPARAEDRR